MWILHILRSTYNRWYTILPCIERRNVSFFGTCGSGFWWLVIQALQQPIHCERLNIASHVQPSINLWNHSWCKGTIFFWYNAKYLFHSFHSLLWLALQMVVTCVIKWWYGVNTYSVTLSQSLCGNSLPLSVPFLIRTSQSSWLDFGNSANINLTFQYISWQWKKTNFLKGFLENIF